MYYEGHSGPRTLLDLFRAWTTFLATSNDLTEEVRGVSIGLILTHELSWWTEGLRAANITSCAAPLAEMRACLRGESASELGMKATFVGQLTQVVDTLTVELDWNGSEPLAQRTPAFRENTEVGMPPRTITIIKWMVGYWKRFLENRARDRIMGAFKPGGETAAVLLEVCRWWSDLLRQCRIGDTRAIDGEVADIARNIDELYVDTTMTPAARAAEVVRRLGVLQQELHAYDDGAPIDNPHPTTGARAIATAGAYPPAVRAVGIAAGANVGSVGNVTVKGVDWSMR